MMKMGKCRIEVELKLELSENEVMMNWMSEIEVELSWS